jgi:hypothetical protein
MVVGRFIEMLVGEAETNLLGGTARSKPKHIQMNGDEG